MNATFLHRVLSRVKQGEYYVESVAAVVTVRIATDDNNEQTDLIFHIKSSEQLKGLEIFHPEMFCIPNGGLKGL